jgi:scavenger receptor class B, member 1
LFIQKLGVPVEGKVRVQLNLRVEHAPAVQAVKQFRDFVFPIMWLEEASDKTVITTRPNI